MRRKIGTFSLKEDKKYRNLFETAAWYRDILVPAGDYDVDLLTENGKNWVLIRLDGTDVGSNFDTLWGGVPVGKPKRNENIGRVDRHTRQIYPYIIAELFANDPDYTPESDVESNPYKHDGKDWDRDKREYVDVTKVNYRLIVDGKEIF